jgi:two-component sensor histidine kinase
VNPKFALFIILIASCTFTPPKKLATYDEVYKEVERLQYIGDSIYQQKSSIENFNESMIWYDSAYKISVEYNDTISIASILIAKGRVYDAWGAEPKKTFDYYNQGADYSIALNDTESVVVAKCLASHALASTKDSIATINYIRVPLKILDGYTHKYKEHLKAMLAYEATCVNNFSLADSIINNLQNVDSINNAFLDFKSKLIIAGARVDLAYKRTNSKWLPKMQTMLADAKNVSDSLTITHILGLYFQKTGNYPLANQYMMLESDLRDRFIKVDAAKDLGNKLSQSQLKEKQLQLQLVNKQSRLSKLTTLIFSILTIGLSFLLYFIYKNKKRLQKHNSELNTLNKDLGLKYEEIDLLNKEIHHRVKNNLYMLYSIVQLQQSKSQSTEVIDELQTVTNRIESIANMHEHLYKFTKESTLEHYVQQLVSNVLSTYSFKNNIITHLHISDVSFSEKQYISIGLIINEWITNSIKHCPLTNKKLELFLKINTTPELITIQYYDNCDAPKSENYTKGLGSTIMQLMVKQLSATMQTAPDNPFHYTITMANATKL